MLGQAVDRHGQTLHPLFHPLWSKGSGSQWKPVEAKHVVIVGIISHSKAANA
jgi:hypothetical protein